MHVSARPQAKVSLARRLASALVRGYVRHFPLERSKWRLLEMTKSFLVAELQSGVFIQLVDMSEIELGIVRQGVFEPETVDVFTSLLEPGMMVLDGGANIGQYTLMAAHAVGLQGHVHAFEPTPRIAAQLRANVVLNRFENVTINEVAISDATGETVLFGTDPGNPGTNTIMSPKERVCSSVTVPTETIDHYLSERGLTGVDVMKLDIEGAELLALRGAQNLLRGDSAPVIVLEINPRTLALSGSSADELLGLLRECGYACQRIAIYGSHTHDPWMNALAAKPGHRDRFPALQRIASSTEPLESPP
jgi:FkbM family methyltransferase